MERCKSYIYHNKTSRSLFSPSAPVCGPKSAPVKQERAPVIVQRTFSSSLEAQLHTFTYDTLVCGPLRSDAYMAGDRPGTVKVYCGFYR